VDEWLGQLLKLELRLRESARMVELDPRRRDEARILFNRADMVARARIELARERGYF